MPQGMSGAAEVRRLVRSVIQQTDRPDEIARRAVDAMDERQREDALLYLLPRLVRQLSRLAVVAGDSDDPATQWATVTAEIVRVDDRDVYLADCSADDVSRLAATRRAAAGNTRRRAERFEKLATVMRSSGAAVVSDVPAEVGLGVMGGADASEQVLRRALAVAPALRSLEERLTRLEAEGSSLGMEQATADLTAARERRDARERERQRTVDLARRMIRGLATSRMTAAWHRLAEEVGE